MIAGRRNEGQEEERCQGGKGVDDLEEGETVVVEPAQSRALEKLIDRWVRPDGGYVIEVRSVDANGKVDAAYLNRRLINVAQAKASRDGGTTKLLVELRDEGYPGSTYTLTHDPQRHTLRGIYYQAAPGQRFDVFFVRAP
jgi:hypothetical protein